MNKILNFIGVAFFVFIGVTSEFCSATEHIPENAKIYVLEEYKTWIPNCGWANEIFLEQASKDPRARESYQSRIQTTYGEIKNGKYKGFELPSSWRTGDYKERIFWGREQSLLRKWILPQERRWNQDGTWNY